MTARLVCHGGCAPWGTRSILACIVVVVLAGTTAAAQRQKIPQAGTPRIADGMPDLSAPMPRTVDGKPDLSGIWVLIEPPTGRNRLEMFMANGARVPAQPWAEELFQRRNAEFGKGRPSEYCLPHSIPDAMSVRNLPFKIVQTPGLTLILYEEFNYYRQVFTDGRPHPAATELRWFGHSVGQWDKDTFVVETKGFNDESWLDDRGRPHTEALRTMERFQRRDFGHLDVGITIDDPKAYTAPFSLTMHFQLMADTEMLENICDIRP